MKVTLNKALKLRNKLSTALSGCQIGVKTTLVRASTAHIVDSEVKQASEEIISELDSYVEDSGALYKLRGIIHSSNVSSGADVIINDMAKLQSVISSVSGRNDMDQQYISRRHVETAQTAEEVKDDIAYGISLASAEDKPFRVVSKLVKLPAVEDYVEKFCKNANLELSQMEEDRNKINHNTIVEIPEDIVKALKSRDVI